MAERINCSLYLVATARERGYTWKEIARALNCTQNGLHLYLERYGYEDPPTIATAKPETPINIEALRCRGTALSALSTQNFSQ